VPVANAPAMLSLCRDPLRPADAYWLPTPRDIAELEGRLPAYVRDTAPSHWKGRWPGVNLDDYHRQYAGVIRGKTKYIIVNLFDFKFDPRATSTWRREVVNVCDGGWYFMTVEYDAMSQSFVSFSIGGGYLTNVGAGRESR